MLALYVDLSAISVVCASLTEYQYAFICVNAMLVIYSWINLIEKLPIYSTQTTAAARSVSVDMVMMKATRT